jgi:hypothetical protein
MVLRMRLTEQPLWIATKDLHHACEQHRVGGAMATGSPPKEWYAKWLQALYQIHNVTDEFLPECVHRSSRIKEDLNSLAIETTNLKSATEYCNSLTKEKRIAGASYVLTGAHLMGGEIMRRRLVDYPTKHLEWEDRKEALSVLGELRSRIDINEEARDCFYALIKIMDEIAE